MVAEINRLTDTLIRTLGILYRSGLIIRVATKLLKDYHVTPTLDINLDFQYLATYGHEPYTCNS